MPDQADGDPKDAERPTTEKPHAEWLPPNLSADTDERPRI